jgi:hypothetical protein
MPHFITIDPPLLEEVKFTPRYIILEGEGGGYQKFVQGCNLILVVTKLKIPRITPSGREVKVTPNML